MKVLIVNTSENTGGAAIASRRLLKALRSNGVEARMLVRDRQTDDAAVVSVGHKWRALTAFLWERLLIFFHLHCHRRHLFEVDTATFGLDITRSEAFRSADVIHLEWVNQGMLSLRGIRKILATGKPVVWTMHDLWPATGICHATLGCKAYKGVCHNCQYLPGHSSQDLSTRVFNSKRKLYKGSGIHFVACSKWLGDRAKQSVLLRGLHVESIPNPIDTHVFCPGDQAEARLHMGLPTDKKVILFVSQRVTMQRKGIGYLTEAISLLAEQHPEMRENTVVAVLGGHAEEVTSQLALPAIPLGYINDERRMVEVYRSASVFVLPSLDENLPNTIMEAMACGIPCVGFNVGGIPEMIVHGQTGYVARERDAADLAHGIAWTLCEANRAALSGSAVAKVAANYSERAVALRYLSVYTDALAQSRFRV